METIPSNPSDVWEMVSQIKSTRFPYEFTVDEALVTGNALQVFVRLVMANCSCGTADDFREEFFQRISNGHSVPPGEQTLILTSLNVFAQDFLEHFGGEPYHEDE